MPMLGTLAGGSVRGFSSGAGVGYEVLSFLATTTLTVTGNNTSNVSVAKTSGSFSWDSHAWVPTPFTAPVTAEFDKLADAGDNGQSYAMISWNADPSASASYDTLDWAIYPYATNNYQVYHNASNIVNGGVWNASVKWYLVYATNGFIYHYNGPTLMASFNTGTGRTVYLDTSFYSVNASYSNFRNIRVIKREWNGTAYV